MPSKRTRKRKELIDQLREMNFTGPLEIAGATYMAYYGKTIAIPNDEDLTVAQFRYYLSELQSLVSHEEWQR